MKSDHRNIRHLRALVLVALATVLGIAAVGLTQCRMAQDNVTGLDLKAGRSGATHRAKDDAEAKIVICHIPPGDPENAHTITVSESALDAHLAHGDQVGECRSGPTCQEECQATHDQCVANAFGDPDFIAVCDDQFVACLATCP